MSTVKFKEFTSEMDENLLFKSISECGRLEVGVYPVIFGFRVRACFVGNQWCELDYCCGDKQETIELIYNGVISILELQEFSDNIFDIFPRQDRKPFPNDIHNFVKFIQLASQHKEKIGIQLPDIHTAKSKYLSKYI